MVFSPVHDTLAPKPLHHFQEKDAIVLTGTAKTKRAVTITAVTITAVTIAAVTMTAVTTTAGTKIAQSPKDDDQNNNTHYHCQDDACR